MPTKLGRAREGEACPVGGAGEDWRGSQDPSNSIPRASSRINLSHTHAASQWRLIAEQLASLLEPDFIDVAFKVRSRHGFEYMGAHRVLIAAAWPKLRDDLRRLEGPPPREVRQESLAWLEPEVPGAASPSATNGSGSLTPSSARVPSPGAHVDFNGVAAGQGGVSESSTSDTSRAAPNIPLGVLDVTSRMWGSALVMRTLLSHLYSRPVAINERDLPIILETSTAVGCNELARCCEELYTRPTTRVGMGGPAAASVAASSRPTTPDHGEVATEARRTRPNINPPAATSKSMPQGLVGGALGGGGNGSGSSCSTVAASGPDDASSLRSHSDVGKLGGAGWASTSSHYSGIGVNTASYTAGPVDEMKPPTLPKKGGGGAKRNSASDAASPEARAGPMSKPREGPKKTFSGEKGAPYNAEKTGAAPDSGGVRRVLSEIKRNIVESSRIIADKTFQQMYELVSGERGILGEGINGPVRLAKHRKTGQEVAVKRVSCVNLSEQRRQMLVSEVRIFLQVSHRNIVQLLEVYESEVDQAVLLVMELCTGRELFERLAERRYYSEFDAARVAGQMLDAVSYLHSQNICHRDLKLENWLYDSPAKDSKLKLCDFGFGQIVEPSVQLTATLGSLFYVAPEVLEGSYGLPCDMWSVGVIVYMLLSGVPPFDGKTDADVMAKIRQGRFVSHGKRWEGISETAKHFVKSMLRKDPYERLTAAEAAQHAWLKMESGQQLHRHPWPKGSAGEAEATNTPKLPIDSVVIRDMWKFAQNNAITRAALGMLAKLNTSSFGGREEDVVLLEKRFRSHDDQNTGKIDAETFIQVLVAHVQMSTAEERLFFERIAGGLLGGVAAETQQSIEDGRPPEQTATKTRRRDVNYGEFITLTKARRMANNTAAIREAFRSFDVSGDGYIKEDDMHSLLGDEFKSTIESYVGENGKDFIEIYHFANVVSQEMANKDTKEEEANVNIFLEKEIICLSREVSRVISAEPPAGDVLERGATSVECFAGAAAGEGAASDSVGAHGVSEANDDSVSPADAHPLGAAHWEPAPSVVEDEQEDEECDADAASDEEQLLNVRDEETPNEAKFGGKEGWDHRQDKKEDVENKEKTKDEKGEKGDKRDEKEKKKAERRSELRFQSFSLSLAGSSEYDDVSWGVNRVISMPSDVYSIRQLPGFHSRILRPFYSARPVSNVVMGLIRGTSLYARQSVSAKLATIIHTCCGWFFIMPNPKYHREVDSRKGLLSKETGKFRFVAWWIHPRFVPQLRQWFERLTYEGLDQERQEQRRAARAQHERGSDATESKAAAGSEAKSEAKSGAAPAPGEEQGDSQQDPQDDSSAAERKAADPTTEDPGRKAKPVDVATKVDAPKVEPDVGSPGDFRFSDVPKPENYLHTYRDLHTRDHVNMLSQLHEGTHRFLRSLFDENFMAHAQISTGFHYPVRSQYATLHMQLRVNSGSVCREDGRGIEVSTLIDLLKRDPHTFERDRETLRYHVTENVKVSLLAAANEYEEQNPGESVARHTSPLSFELGLSAMPTIHDDENEEEDGRNTRGSRARAASEEGLKESNDYKIGKAHGMNATTERSIEGLGREHVGDPAPWPDRRPEEAEAPASYLVNLQPSMGSRFHEVLYERRAACAATFGADPTYLYPLHVSVTGFFEAPSFTIRPLVTLMRALLHQCEEEADEVTVGNVICTKTGYVLFDMKAAAITSFSQRLGERSARELNVHIRPKAVNHISLACDRHDEDSRENIKSIYEGTYIGEVVEDLTQSAKFDIVLSRLLARSSFERLAEDGPHAFAELARLSLGAPVLPLAEESIPDVRPLPDAQE